MLLLLGCQPIDDYRYQSNTEITEIPDQLSTEQTPYIVPRSDFQVFVPDDWVATYDNGPYSDDPAVLKIEPDSTSLSFLVLGHKFHENQDKQTFIEQWLHTGKIINTEQVASDSLSGVIGFSSPDDNENVNALLIIGTENQVIIISNYISSQQIDEAKEIFIQLLAMVKIENENPRKAELADRQTIGDTNFTIQRLTGYRIRPFTDSSIQMEGTLDGLSPRIDILWYFFDDEQAAQEWLLMRMPQYVQHENITINGIEGFIEEFDNDGGRLKVAKVVMGNQGLVLNLVGSASMPQENNDVFYTVLESIEWDGQSKD